MESDGNCKAVRNRPALVRGGAIAAGENGLTVCLFELRPWRLDVWAAKRSDARDVAVGGNDDLEDEGTAADVSGNGAGGKDGLRVGDYFGLSRAVARMEETGLLSRVFMPGNARGHWRYLGCGGNGGRRLRTVASEGCRGGK